MTPPPAPWCCRTALLDGYPARHHAGCPYAAEQLPQPDALFGLTDPKTTEGGPLL